MEILGIEERIINYMQEEYHLTPNRNSIKLIIDSGFRFVESKPEQYSISDMAQKKIIGYDTSKRVAKIFLLGYSLNYVLGDKEVSPQEKIWWVTNLGTCEHKLAIEEDYKSRKIDPVCKKLFEISIEHLLKAEELGHKTKLNTSYLGISHLELGNYKKAKEYFISSRELGNESKQNASYLGACFFELGNFKEGINEYKNALEIAIKEDSNIYWPGEYELWLHTFDHALEKSFFILKNAIVSMLEDSEESNANINLLQEFKNLYDKFENQARKYFALRKDGEPLIKLRAYVNGTRRDLINDALLEFEASNKSTNQTS